ncbi:MULTISPECIES: polysaccharide biosynthesis/export family protein [Niastella]|uniref:Polysaccharide biosynthesis/export family protein n=1 Tax=Niastella soli TaxID=2821487 RepID=A0ABS3YLY0_9BACT|nr:polysaccharide biosynthesis/export family protein [Niastella soli]MBO9198838.1 polysaccharide biosynthesis/export family protein [Niastella soli]
MNRNHITLTYCVGVIFMLTTSCSTSKKLNYFDDLPNAETYELKAMPVPERIIERGDRLDINFIVKDQESAAFFNKHSMAGAANAAAAAVGVGGGVGTGGGTGGADYVVNEEGEVEIPVVGRLKLAGLTASQAKQKLYGAVSPYLKEPLIEVSFTTFKVTVLGEVKTPGSFVIPAQQATLFTALAAAGDLPHTAKRYDIRLYRDYNGKRTIRKFDLRKASVLDDPDIFLMRPNDVIYVQARSNSIFKEESGLMASMFTVVISIVTLGFTIHNTTK